jgi:dipeptidyl aminopeptidase/acylaminoacyl peptidase
VGALTQENDDVLAAAAWLAAQPGIDPGRLVVMGISFGGIMTVLAAAGSGYFRAAVNFAGAAMTWDAAPALRTALLEAVRRLEVPIFLIQASNDFNLAPTYALGAELARLGKPHETRIYGPCGTTPVEGHRFAMIGIPTWRGDVQRFLHRWLTQRE